MSLGPQCWGCRWRRVRCDSQIPDCSKCVQKGLMCPGYSATRPLRWRHHIARPETVVQPPPISTYQAPVQEDVAPPLVISDALNYYNAIIAPDLAADGSSSLYTIDISKWADFNISRRHLTLCLVTLHRAVRKYGDVKHNQALYHYHQACAAEILSHKIQAFGQAGPDPELFEDVSLFFFSQIQASAYGAWRAHLSAAKTLFNLWGVDALMGDTHYEFFLCHLVLADVFGTAMAPTSYISIDDIRQHETYLTLLGRFSVDVCSTMVPIPEAIVRSTAATNISRAARSASDALPTIDKQYHAPSVPAILESLQSFDPTDWALHRPRCTSSQATSWALFAASFQSAAVLYLVQTCGTEVPAADQDFVVVGYDSFYNRLKDTIRDLYDLKQHGGVLYKYILWPMVVSGVEAVARNDEQHLRSLCQLLEQTTVDLGTLSMREAAVFLEELWNSAVQQVTGNQSKIKLDWDTVFDHAPLFLM